MCVHNEWASSCPQHQAAREPTCPALDGAAGGQPPASQEMNRLTSGSPAVTRRSKSEAARRSASPSSTSVSPRRAGHGPSFVPIPGSVAACASTRRVPRSIRTRRSTVPAGAPSFGDASSGESRTSQPSSSTKTGARRAGVWAASTSPWNPITEMPGTSPADDISSVRTLFSRGLLIVRSTPGAPYRSPRIVCRRMHPGQEGAS